MRHAQSTNHDTNIIWHMHFAIIFFSSSLSPIFHHLPRHPQSHHTCTRSVDIFVHIIFNLFAKSEHNNIKGKEEEEDDNEEEEEWEGKNNIIGFYRPPYFVVALSLSLSLFIFNQRRRYTLTHTLTHTHSRGMCINVKFNRFRPIDMFQCEFWFVCYSFELFFPSSKSSRHTKKSHSTKIFHASPTLWLCYDQINNSKMFFDAFLLIEIYVCTQ